MSVSDTQQKAVKAAYDALKANMPGFRDRASQRQMIGACARAAASKQGALLAEAPCGTGKSLAYLTACLPVALDTERKLVISTGTVALQEQLVNRDIPAFLAATGLSAKVALAKGRSRYLCVRNAADMASGHQQDDLDLGDGKAAWTRPPAPGEIDQVNSMTRELQAGRWDGDLDALSTPLSAPLRQMVTTTAGACPGRNCSYSASCPLLKARALVKDADIIVCNHSLLLQDLQLHTPEGVRGGVLLHDPNNSVIVCDEAHNLEGSAIEAGAHTLNLGQAAKWFQQIEGAMRRAFRAADKETINGATVDVAQNDAKALAGAFRALQHAAMQMSDGTPVQNSTTYRAPSGALPDHLLSVSAEARDSARMVSGHLRALDIAVKASKSSDKVKAKLERDVGSAKEVVEQWTDCLAAWCRKDAAGGQPNARWISASYDLSPILNVSPVSGTDFLSKILFDSGASIVLTSATMTSGGGDFSGVLRGCGVPSKAETICLQSPFDLAEQGRVVVPHMQSMPNEHDAHVAEVAAWLNAKLPRDAGSMILFTSKRKLTETLAQLDPALRAITKVQGETSRQTLLDQHQLDIAAGKGSAIFGLHGLGEGVDLKGAALTELVLTQMPFQNPGDPVGATLNEWVESRGGNSFSELSIPYAIRMLLQYAGRLIRTQDDAGNIYILDRRLATKAYGRRVLNALRPFPITIEPAARRLPA